MTAPSAAHLPLSARSLAVRPPGSRLRRRLRGMAAVVLLAAATGCVTVHGASALVPATDKAGAQKALRHFVQVSNEANTKLDPALNSGVETGALSAIDGAGIKAKHIKAPAGDPGYQPLVLSDTRFLIPRQRGWPKWFVADSADNKDQDRWELAFTRYSVDQPWKAAYLLAVPPAQLPDFATDSKGYAEPVPLAGSGLLVQPGELGDRYATYLRQGGKGPALFADGPYTSQVLKQRRTDYAPGPRITTAFADSPADPVGDPTVALRLKDGGAMVFFSTEHRVTQTSNSGGLTVSDPFIKALMTGTPNTSVVLFRAAEQAVSVPARNAGTGGRVTFLAHIDGVVSAHGQ